MCKQPQSSHQGGVLLGWNSSSRGRFGFGPGDPRGSVVGEPLWYRGDNHLMTVAPTGAGKGRGVIIPNLLSYPGPAVIIDPKGEAYQTTARRRRQMGQQVVVLDPFRVVTDKSDRLNPLEVFELPGAVVDCDAEMMASLLSMGHHFTRDPFWSDSATGVVAGLIAHIGSSDKPEERTLNRLRHYLYHDDMDSQLAHALDQKVVKNQLARDEFVGYLSHPSKETRPSVRTTACTYVKALGSVSVAETLEPSSFKLADVVSGKPMTIYVVIPPEKLESHRALLRLWVGTLLTAVTSRKMIPPSRTLFILDESAQLGSLGALKQAITLLRGYGLQVWTFWQDISQLKTLYANDWQTMLNNSGVLQVFGLNNHLMAKEWAEVMGVESSELAGLSRDDAGLFVQGEYQRCRRADYLTDRVFRGQYDDNPRFALLNKTEDVSLAV